MVLTRSFFLKTQIPDPQVPAQTSLLTSARQEKSVCSVSYLEMECCPNLKILPWVPETINFFSGVFMIELSEDYIKTDSL